MQNLCSPIINDILDFSKVEAGKLELESIAFEPRNLVNSVVHMLRSSADKSGLQLTADVPPEVPAWLIGDPNRLRQILLNLANNAIKFTKTGGVDLEMRVIALRDDRVTIRTSVRDTGIGIEPSDQRFLFEAFSQADSSTTRRFGGTGLGLAICKQLVELMHGDIGVDSTPGQGSTFWFRIAFEPAKAPAPADVRVGVSPKALRTLDLIDIDRLNTPILLVEDNVVNQKIVLAALQKRGLTVELATNGQEAIDKLEINHYAVVLMDLQMPVMVDSKPCPSFALPSRTCWITKYPSLH